MATTPNFSYALSEESAVHHFINLQLCDSADLFELADTCAACVSVLVETDDSMTFSLLCDRLLALLKRLRECCDTELPPHLVERLIAGEKIVSCVPDCWQETALQVDYALALTRRSWAGHCLRAWRKNSPGYCMIWSGCWRSL